MPALQNTSALTTHTEKRLANPKYAKALLHNSIMNFNDGELKLALDALKKQKVDLNGKVSDKSGPVLFTAIRFNNVLAVGELIKSGLVDVRAEWDGANAINCAALFGNPIIFNLVYMRDKNVNDICYDTPLIKVLVQFASFSLVHYSNWGSAGLKEQLLSWFNNGTHIKGEIAHTDQYQEGPTLEASWDGSVELIKSLLDYGANPKVRGDNGLSAEYIINNMDKPECLKILGDGDPLNSLKFISKSADGNVLSFFATIANKGKTKKIRIKLNYDIRQVKKLINETAEKVADSGYQQWDKRLTEAEKAAKDAAAAAGNAVTLAVATHNQTAHLTHVVNANALTLAETQGNVGKLQQDMVQAQANIQTMIEDYKPLKEKAKLEGRLNKIKEKGIQYSFYEEVHKRIYDFIDSFRKLNGGKIKNEAYSVAHKVGDVVELVGGKIPIIGIAAGLISKGINKAADFYESRKWERVYHLAPADHAEFSKELAIAITEAYQDDLNCISTANPEEAIKQALKLATNAADIITESMSDTKVDKKKGVPQGVVEAQLSALRGNEKFGAMVAKFAPPSQVQANKAKEEAELAKARLSAKTHSPGKSTTVAPVCVVLSQPLPGPAAASAKPKPPVPAKPPVGSAAPAAVVGAKPNPPGFTPAAAAAAAVAAARAAAAAALQRPVTAAPTVRATA